MAELNAAIAIAAISSKFEGPSNLTFKSTHDGDDSVIGGHLNGWNAECDMTSPVRASHFAQGALPYEVMVAQNVSLTESKVFTMNRFRWYPVDGARANDRSLLTLMYDKALVSTSSKSHP